MRAEKVQMLNVVKELLQDKPVFIIGFNALTVAEFSEFRAKLAALGAEVHVVKNTMITKAAEALGYEALAAQKLRGQSDPRCSSQTAPFQQSTRSFHQPL